MKQKFLIEGMLILILTVGCKTGESADTSPKVRSDIVTAEAASPAEAAITTSPATEAPELTPSCADPTEEMAASCQARVEEILAATVRIELEYWSEGRLIEGSETTGIEVSEATSHATLVDGRYLVTHNHFPISPRQLKEGADGPQLRISLYKLNGETILQGASLRKFDVVAEQPETLVLNFREPGEVLFKVAGVQSMPMATVANAHPEPGMEAAQINWDGQTTWVQWVRIESVVEEQGVTRISLNDGVRKGASGGGVFWNGQHIGNNWKSSEVKDGASGETVSTFSVAAFNVDEISPGEVTVSQPSVTADTTGSSPTFGAFSS